MLSYSHLYELNELNEPTRELHDWNRVGFELVILTSQAELDLYLNKI